MKTGIKSIAICFLTLWLSISISFGALAAKKIEITDVRSDPPTAGKYEVIYDPGVKDNVPGWHDRAYFFVKVPKEYEGMPFIKNNIYPVNDKYDDPLLVNYKLTFNLTDWGYVYVAWDTRRDLKEKERPEGWLSGNDYIKMDKQLIWCHAVGGEEVPCDVYRSNKPVKGEFATYGYTDAVHYIVFVGEAPEATAVSLGNRLATCWARLKTSD